MKKRGFVHFLLGFILIIMSYQSSASNNESDPLKVEVEKHQNSVSVNVSPVYWAFSGSVTNENGEKYNYYFQIQHKEKYFHAIATLIDNQTKKVLLLKESEATIEHFLSTNWRIGDLFMQFNPINNSWVFGVKTKANNGFNFKVDMLGQALTTPLRQGLRTGIELMVNQTGRLNGHFKTGGKKSKDQFVTAPKAWFKQIWVTKAQDALHPLRGVLCDFNDGSGFYSVNLQESDALKGAIAGWRNEEGSAVPMSQFVSVEEVNKEGFWSINIPSPKVHLSLQNALGKNSGKYQLIAGLTIKGLPGFCTITKDEIGNLPKQVQEIKTT